LLIERSSLTRNMLTTKRAKKKVVSRRGSWSMRRVGNL